MKKRMLKNIGLLLLLWGLLFMSLFSIAVFLPMGISSKTNFYVFLASFALPINLLIIVFLAHRVYQKSGDLLRVFRRKR